MWQILLFACLSLANAGLFSDTLTMTGNAENDFTTDGTTPRKGVVVIEDSG
jgi:hypothetical protein